MRLIGTLSLLCVVVRAAPFTATGDCKQIQYPFPEGTYGDPSKAEAVKQAYLRSWNQYAQYAFGNDSILPLNNSQLNDFYGWGLDIVDGIDTAVVMGLTDVVEKQLEWIANVDFTSSPMLIGGFDAIIRYVGGLIGAYDLLTSDFVPAETYNQDHIDSLLSQAQTLSNKLKPLFDTPSGLPATFINFTNNKISYSNYTINDITYDSINTAISGTIIIEWHRLSDLTGDESFRNLADNVNSILMNPDPAPRYPGLVGSQLDVKTGKYLNQEFGWQSGIDSFFEYLIKSYIYKPSADTAEPYRDFWIEAVESTEEHLALHPYGFDELTFITQADEKGNLKWEMDDYACFIGGNLLLGGKYLDRDDMIDLGLAVTDACHQTFNTTESGLNPITFAWYNGTNKAYNSSYNDDPAKRAFFEKSGYFIERAIWAAFPEPIESIFYAYRITGDTRWQDYNWEIFQTILRDTYRTVDVPFADLKNVSKPLGGKLVNYLPSYYFAETLKYLYLTFSSPDLISLDEYVFTTECHPVKIQEGTCAVDNHKDRLRK